MVTAPARVLPSGSRSIRARPVAEKNRMPSPSSMSSAISVRLDPEALHALAQLESTGLSRSEAIRTAILDSAGRLRRRAALAAEVAALEADENDRREMVEVAEFRESMRAAG
jgi:hypothetical protein